MYKEDHRFDTPEDEGVIIWRYMTIDKYADMLESHTLYFCRGERLQEQDPYEGSYLSFELLKLIPPEKAVEFTAKIKACGYPITVNCWHMNPFESFAMWRLYGNMIAIQSTVGRLIKALAKCPCDVYVGKVWYITPGKDSFTPECNMNIFTPWLHKHRGFEYEHELRAIIWDTPEGFPREFDGSVRAPIDPEVLVECAYVAPRAESHVRDDVESMNGQHGFKIPVRQSELAKPPY